MLDKKINPVTGNVEYLLQWKNWDGEPTWEPEDNCDCTLLIKKFEKELQRRESSNQSSSSATQGGSSSRRASRTTVKRRANVLRSSSSSSGNQGASASQPAPRISDGDYSDQVVAIRRRSDRVRESTSRNVVDLTRDSSSETHVSSDDARTSRIIDDVPAIEWPYPQDQPGPRAKSPSPQQFCDSSCSEWDSDKIRERKLKLKEIVGAVNAEQLLLIVKWHGLPDLEKVPLKVLRNFYCQEILDFLIQKIKWT